MSSRISSIGRGALVASLLGFGLPEGVAPASAQRTCGNWTSSSSTGSAQVGYFDLSGEGDNPNSWNSAHGTHGCSEDAFRSSGGAGLLYCFALD